VTKRNPENCKNCSSKCAFKESVDIITVVLVGFAVKAQPNETYRRDGVAVGNQYGAGSGQIWLDNVVCEGNETSIAACKHRPWATHNCDHDEDVSVACNGTSIGN